MKKHVSLFLALLLMFSVLFAIPVEAASPEGGRTEEISVSADSLSGQAPVCAEPIAAGTQGAVTPGNCTSHVFRCAGPWGSGHRMICVNCGKTIVVNHTIVHLSSGRTPDYHLGKCTVCSAIVQISHTWYGPVRGILVCKYCGYQKLNPNSQSVGDGSLT